MPLSNENMRFIIKIYLFFLNVIQKMIHLKRTFQNWKTFFRLITYQGGLFMIINGISSVNEEHK